MLSDGTIVELVNNWFINPGNYRYSCEPLILMNILSLHQILQLNLHPAVCYQALASCPVDITIVIRLYPDP